MTPSDRRALINQILLHEGLRLKLYTDSLGVPTLGVGRNVRDKGISNEEAFMLLAHDIDEAIADLTQSFLWFAALDPVRQRVLIDMRFNMGPNTFREFRHTLHAVAVGNYTAAADGMLASRWALQVKGRAETLARMMRTGEDHEGFDLKA